jgi:hypothetical protein
MRGFDDFKIKGRVAHDEGRQIVVSEEQSRFLAQFGYTPREALDLFMRELDALAPGESLETAMRRAAATLLKGEPKKTQRR